jgi:hypothetical protein
MASIYDAYPLNTGRSTNIRLVKILRTKTCKPDDMISCEWKVVSLKRRRRKGAKKTYRALSYVWGNDSVTKTILLDGQPFTVRENLWRFLHEYRREGANGYLWIDALCIDQSSNKERNHQVAMMGQIYSAAVGVIAWLGIKFEEPLKMMFDGKVQSWFDKFKLISTCDYWSRLWIVQEFILGQNVEVWSATARIDGDVFWLAWFVTCKRTSAGRKHHPPSLEHFLDLLLIRSASRTLNNGNELSSAIDSDMVFRFFGHTKCSDPRDRIYGLLGIMNPVEMRIFSIYPNYSQSKSMLFVELWNRRRQMEAAYPVNCSSSDYIIDLVFLLELNNDDENVVTARSEASTWRKIRSKKARGRGEEESEEEESEEEESE